jgi:hypothetical protein
MKGVNPTKLDDTATRAALRTQARDVTKSIGNSSSNSANFSARQLSALNATQTNIGNMAEQIQNQNADRVQQIDMFNNQNQERYNVDKTNESYLTNTALRNAQIGKFSDATQQLGANMQVLHRDRMFAKNQNLNANIAMLGYDPESANQIANAYNKQLSGGKSNYTLKDILNKGGFSGGQTSSNPVTKIDRPEVTQEATKINYGNTNALDNSLVKNRFNAELPEDKTGFAAYNKKKNQLNVNKQLQFNKSFSDRGLSSMNPFNYKYGGRLKRKY